MRSFTVRILANNQAGQWASWPAKIAAIKAFYAVIGEITAGLRTQRHPNADDAYTKVRVLRSRFRFHKHLHR
jgi:hypothetical protein